MTKNQSLTSTRIQYTGAVTCKKQATRLELQAITKARGVWMPKNIRHYLIFSVVALDKTDCRAAAKFLLFLHLETRIHLCKSHTGPFSNQH
jgi:hypothetical protein